MMEARRLAALPDSALRSRRLGSFGHKLVCAPSYLGSDAKIEGPDDLKRCDFVNMVGLANQILLFKHGQEAIVQATRARVLVDSFAALQSALRAGLGIQRLPIPVVQVDLESGVLVKLLPDWKITDLGTYAVWPDTSRRSSLTRLLIDHIVAFTV